MILSLVLLTSLAADPITPSQLREALKSPPKGEVAMTLADRIRESLPEGADPARGAHLAEEGLVKRHSLIFG
ncbi:hypothetical protein [Tautonia plasticadhaerens]|uniref:Uncharacterized protein n=1 Tax=Tautonia plasticadhaerens TaxID=2527974 RepID=A0A518GWP6_9BACT|nr:hypothetical protein [Tautonia plasticadhaerens]QDV33003.1 hypothetical protein ElP_08450 [Tautonia plasticadhaerens]